MGPARYFWGALWDSFLTEQIFTLCCIAICILWENQNCQNTKFLSYRRFFWALRQTFTNKSRYTLFGLPKCLCSIDVERRYLLLGFSEFFYFSGSGIFSNTYSIDWCFSLATQRWSNVTQIMFRSIRNIRLWSKTGESRIKHLMLIWLRLKRGFQINFQWNLSSSNPSKDYRNSF